MNQIKIDKTKRNESPSIPKTASIPSPPYYSLHHLTSLYCPVNSNLHTTATPCCPLYPSLPTLVYNGRLHTLVYAT